MDPTRLLSSDWLALPALAAGGVLLAALVSSLATLALVLAFAPRLRAGQRTDDAASDSGACEFLLVGTSVKALTEPARALLADLGPAPSPMAALAAHLARDCPEVQPRIEALVLYGTAFRTHCARADGSACEISGRPRGSAALLSIRQPSDDARALQDARSALTRAGDELRFLRDAFDEAPVLAWSVAPDGQVSWANAPYRDAFDAPGEGLADHRIPDGFGHVLEEVPLTARAGETRARVAVPGRDGAEPRWYEVCRRPGPDGGMLGFAVEADDLVAAEASLRRFVETLTETFAHLPIGLAVFDKNRRLGLFNPALTDLVRIDAVWLAGRPSLRDFLERLRETRQMPEQKDFAAWRRKLTELEEGARDGTYEENWVLPSGKVFRVTGRPHPQGALAFLFEDISTTIQLERRYRSELELSQATLDRLTEAVAVFDAAGALVFVNAAFEALWGLDTMERLDGPGVAELTRIWAERCAPSPAWAALAEYATAAEARSSWSATLATREGRALQMAVAPLPDASTLVVFRVPEVPARDPVASELALEQLALPVETALAEIVAAIASAQTPEAFRALSATVQGLKDGLARAREIAGLPQGAVGGMAGPLSALAAAMAERGVELAVTGGEASLADPELRRAAMAVGLAAAGLAAPAGRIELALDTAPGVRAVTLTAPAGPRGPGTADIGLALARRVVEAAGGRLRLDRAAGRVCLTAELPALAPRVAEAAAQGASA